MVAVEDARRRARLAELAGGQKHIVEAPLFLVWLADLHRLERLGAARGVPTDGLSFLETLLLSTVDIAIAAQNAVMALESLGLGAVYIGGIRNNWSEQAAQRVRGAEALSGRHVLKDLLRHHPSCRQTRNAGRVL